MANESIGLMTNFTLSGISNFILNWAPNESTQRQGAHVMVRIEENVPTKDTDGTKSSAHYSIWIWLGVGIFGVLAISIATGCVVWIKKRYSDKLMRSFRRFRATSGRGVLEHILALPFFPQQSGDVWEVSARELRIFEERLGAGASAIVRRGYLEGIPPVARIYPSLQLSYFLGNDGNDVAVKSPHEQVTHADREEFLAEIEFMKQLPFHPHILSLVGCSTNPDYPLIVTGICELGALLSLLRQMDPEHLKYEESPLEFDDLVPIGWQISDALVFLSAKEIVHRDVAARNVLVTKDKTAKLSDFGLCRFQKDMVAGVRDGKFPIKWMAPEAIEFADFSPECDVWSFGVLLYEMYNYGKSPWSDVEPAELLPLLKEGKRLKIPFTAPEFILKTSATCWEENPEDRPRFEDIRERFYKEMEDHAELYGYLDVCKRYYTLLEQTSEAAEDSWEDVDDEKF